MHIVTHDNHLIDTTHHRRHSNRISLLLTVAALFGVWLWLGLTPSSAWAGMNPPATMANSYKLVVPADGLYHVTYTELQSAGLPVSSLDPRTFKLWLNGAEVNIQVVGEADGQFNSSDYILFYGQAANTRYAGPNVYWLTYGNGNGARMAAQSVTPGSGNVPASFLRTLHMEENHEYSASIPMTEGGDHWYWDKFRAPCYNPYNCKATKTYTFDLANLATGAYTATLRPRLRGTTSYSANPDHHAQMWLNGHFLGDAYWDGTDEFTGTFTFDQTFLITGTNTISYHIPLDLGVSDDAGFTNWLEVDYHDVYSAENDSLAFTFDTTGTWQATLAGFSSPDVRLLDITDPQHPVQLTDAVVTPDGTLYDLTASLTVNSLPAHFLAVAAPADLSVSSITLDTPSDLRATSHGADWIAITHADFMTETQQLAAHRQSFSGYRTAVVDVQDVYDEFSGGVLNPEAIRDFVAYAYNNWQKPAPRYLLLVGDGSYDYHNYQGYPDKIYIPPYMDMVDCFFGEVPADNRYVAGARTNSDPNVPECQKWAMPFMAVGRFPVNSTAEAQTMVYRTICYEDPTDPACGTLNPPAGWNTRAIFVSDDNDGAGNFTEHSDMVAGQEHDTDVDFGYHSTTLRSPARRSPITEATGQPQLQRTGRFATTNRLGEIGDLVWNDSDGDGTLNGSETGIAGVLLNLWLDANGNDTLDSQDSLVMTTTTDSNGSYLFAGLGRYVYFVEIDSSNFAGGGALAGMVVTTGADWQKVDLSGYLPRGISADKLYYRDTDSSSNDVKDKLKTAINNGALFVNYNGHASTWKWGGEDFFDTSDVEALTNSDAWPIFLPMTCLEGQFSTPGYPSVGESVARAMDSSGHPVGGVASWSPAGFGVATGHTVLSTNFYKATFQNGVSVMGDAILHAKQALYDSSSLFKDLVESYNLFGDPALVMQVPRPDLRVTKQVSPASPISAGDWLTYTMQISNHGTLPAPNVVISDPLPSLLENASWTASNSAILPQAGETYVWNLLSLDVGQHAWITLTAQASSALTDPTVITNVVTVTSALADEDPADNTARAVNNTANSGYLSGLTWNDANANGVLDANEQGRLANIQIEVSNDQGTTVASPLTDSSGYYTLTLPTGTYTVTAADMTGYVHTTPASRSVAVPTNDATAADFGYISPTAVEVVAFKTSIDGKQVTLHWQMANEDGIVGFYVARARTTIATAPIISALLPTGGAGTAYTFKDTPPADGSWYYWLYPVLSDGACAQAIGPRVVNVISQGEAYHVFLPFSIRH